MAKNKIIFLIQCEDKKGILAKISSFFYAQGFNILSCQQFTDTIQNRYFMRVSLDAIDLKQERADLENRFAKIADELNSKWAVHYTEDIINIGIMVSKTSHCLFDLLEKQSEGKLNCNIPLIISNYPDIEYVAKQFKIPFHHVPIKDENKIREQEDQILRLLKKNNVDLVVLARYMRILSPDFIKEYPEKIINIHHAFLPAFKGAKPYERAYERGVKMIGATAHYTTDKLDEGPIIEQDVESVSHVNTPEKLTGIGADIERKVLSKAVKSHLENRIIVTGNRTIVFPETNE